MTISTENTKNVEEINDNFEMNKKMNKKMNKIDEMSKKNMTNKANNNKNAQIQTMQMIIFWF